MKFLLAVTGVLCQLTIVFGQFSGAKIISSNSQGASSVFAIDLDLDSDLDILTASEIDSTIAWHENLGNGLFGAREVISNNVLGAMCVHAADLDGDLYPDVLAVAHESNTISWFKNLGNGSFGSEQVLSNSANGAESVFVADTDGDADLDILITARWDNEIGLFENLGSGVFGAMQTISSSVASPRQVMAADLDGDGANDIIGVSDNYVVWFENQGSNNFSPSQQLHYLFYMISACVADIDNDGDLDIIAVSLYETALIENLGNGVFAAGVTINSSLGGLYVVSEDFNGDGWEDFIVADGGANSIYLYQNNTVGGFLPHQVISGVYDYVKSVYGSDLDGDGDADILSASYDNNQVAWNENLEITDVQQNELSDVKIYPNPTRDFIYIEAKDTRHNSSTLKVMDALGRLVDTETSITENSVRVNVSSLNTGIYNLSILTNGINTTSKFIVE